VLSGREFPLLEVAAYNASKAAVNSFTIALSWELRKDDIKVNSAHPGWIATKINGFPSNGATVEQGAKVLLPLALLGPEDKEKTG
jgi:NAD(P)-dependent dehydrogenase (short-subunit alcohol dehydrogenase family)